MPDRLCLTLMHPIKQPSGWQTRPTSSCTQPDPSRSRIRRPATLVGARGSEGPAAGSQPAASPRLRQQHGGRCSRGRRAKPAALVHGSGGGSARGGHCVRHPGPHRPGAPLGGPAAGGGGGLAGGPPAGSAGSAPGGVAAAVFRLHAGAAAARLSGKQPSWQHCCRLPSYEFCCCCETLSPDNVAACPDL